MSFICFNGEIQPADSSPILFNRAFLYADGLFETMIFDGQEIQYLDDHLERLKNGLHYFKYNIPPKFLSELPSLLIDTILKNHFNDKVRIKLIVWRNSGGLYNPNNNDFSFLISCKENITYNETTITKLGLNKDFLLPNNPMGNFKTLNALYYVRASQICNEHNMQDMIFLNSDYKVCECTSSNIFWERKGIFYTPSLKSGCISGVRRKNFIKQLTSQGKQVLEGLYKVDSLLDADKYYLTNVTGIRTCNFITT